MRVGGVILCGGQSTRMGRPKALLPFGEEVMLQRIVRLLGEVVQPCVVVAARDQQLPALPSDIAVARDEQPERGPVEGLFVGLSALPDDVEAAYVTSCDVPLLHASFVNKMIELLGEHEVAVPVEHDAERNKTFYHPLAAVYRRTVLEPLQRLRAADRLRPVFLYDEVSTLRVPVEQLREVDPELQTLANLNRPEDYQQALRDAGF